MTTVMIFGTFDILHYGHIVMFGKAREYGDRLIAVVARDETVEKIKRTRPFHNENERKEILKQIRLIDDVLLGDTREMYRNIREVKPDVIALGYDQKVFVDDLAVAITDYGLNTRIVRLLPYLNEKYKTSKIKEYLVKTQ